MPLYFAYGSNMSTSRLRTPQRAPSATIRSVGRLPGHDLRFHKRSEDGSGKADAFQTKRSDDVVWGVVFECSDADLHSLDLCEGAQYRRVLTTVSVSHDDIQPDSIVEAWVYIAEHAAIDPAANPHEWYKRHVIDGAREHGLPAEYIARLERVRTTADLP